MSEPNEKKQTSAEILAAAFDDFKPSELDLERARKYWATHPRDEHTAIEDEQAQLDFNDMVADTYANMRHDRAQRTPEDEENPGSD